MPTMAKKLMESNTGAIIISVIIGLGLAALFRRACHGDGCVVIKAPNMEEVKKHVYKIQSDCFKYTPEVIPCPLNKGGKGKPIPV